MRKLNSFLGIPALFLIAVFSTFSSGCGNSAYEKQSDESYSKYKASLSALSLKTRQDVADANLWTCPNENNITLSSNVGYNGFSFNGDGSFKACESRDIGGTFRISGTPTSSAICIYPFYKSANSDHQWIEDKQCFNVNRNSMSPLIVNFKSTYINYLVIVDQNFSQSMTNCLSGASSCPPHSEGFIE